MKLLRLDQRVEAAPDRGAGKQPRARVPEAKPAGAHRASAGRSLQGRPLRPTAYNEAGQLHLASRQRARVRCTTAATRSQSQVAAPGMREPGVGDSVVARGEVPRGLLDAPVGVIGAPLARMDAVVAHHVSPGGWAGGARVGVPADLGVGDDVALDKVVARNLGPGAGEDDPSPLSRSRCR